VLACLFGRNPLIANPALPFVGWMLLAHACMPPAPYGSVAARGRIDPGGGWRFPRPLFAAAWIVMAIGYSYSGITKLVSPSWVDGTALSHVLENPLARPTALRELALAMPPVLLKLATWGGLALELAFAPLALVRVLRPWIWSLMVGMHVGLFAVVDFADLTLGMLLLHAFTFDPAWLAPREADRRAVVFYDGHCGLCHRFVRFVLAEDAAGDVKFAPLEGSTFAASVPADRRAALPDSVVVKTADGRILVRSAAVQHVMRGLGGAWRALAIASRVVPRALLDFAYDRVAAVRKRLFASPTEACPMLPPELRARFGD
jgi:predicted DCC family thiol-disulfide oxidoreductase YuxK